MESNWRRNAREKTFAGRGGKHPLGARKTSRSTNVRLTRTQLPGKRWEFSCQRKQRDTVSRHPLPLLTKSLGRREKVSKRSYVWTDALSCGEEEALPPCTHTALYEKRGA